MGNRSTIHLSTIDFTTIFENPSFSHEDFMHFWVDMLSECARDEPLRKMVAENVEMHIQMIRQLLEEQGKSGSTQIKGDLRSKSAAALVILTGAIFLRILKFDEAELRRVTRNSLNAVLEAD